MPEGITYEYKIIGCPLNDPDRLEETLNKMSLDGWDLYMLNEGESQTGSSQYNCIFYREIEEKTTENDKILEVNDFKSRMEKLFGSSAEPYEKSIELQKKIKQKQNTISEIKKKLDSDEEGINYRRLNDEISKNLEDLNNLRSQLGNVSDPAQMFDRINQDKLSISISDELIHMVDSERNGELISETIRLRQKLTDELGYIIPFVKYSHDNSLEENEFEIKVRGIDTLKGFVYPNHVMYFKGQANLEEKPENAIEEIDILTSQIVYWLPVDQTKDFWEKGLTTSQVITRALEYVVCKHVDEILDYSDMNNYLGLISDLNIFLIEELLDDFLTISDLRYIFASLIRERVSVKDILFIFERLNDYSQEALEKEQILEKLRVAMSRHICNNLADEENNIYAAKLDDELSISLEDCLIERDDIFELSEENDIVKQFLEKLDDNIDDSIDCILCSPSIRLELFNLLELNNYDISVLSISEMNKNYNFKLVKTISKL